MGAALRRQPPEPHIRGLISRPELEEVMPGVSVEDSQRRYHLVLALSLFSVLSLDQLVDHLLDRWS